MTQEEIAKRIPELIEAGIDFTKFGWLSKALKIIPCKDCTFKKALKKFYPEIYEKTFKQRPRVSFSKQRKRAKTKVIDNKKIFICECGKEFNDKNVFGAHCSHCEIHTGKPRRIPFAGHQGWDKGITKDDSRYDSFLRFVRAAQTKDAIEKRVKSYKKKYYSKTKEELEQQYKKQSITRKERILSGEIDVSEISSKRGYNCYILNNNKKFWMRSSYEFVFALFLSVLNIDFNYESIRAQDIDMYKVFICDFVVNKTIYEIKGFCNDDTYFERYKKAFNEIGYDVVFLFGEQIKWIKNFFKENSIDINSLINNIRDAHYKKEYLTIDLNNFKKLNYSTFEINKFFFEFALNSVYKS